jgi:SAM-dependent methyltransferase
MSTVNISDRFVTVDENGWIIFDNQQINDPALAHEFYTELNYLPNRSFGTTLMGHNVVVEAFDAPMIVQSFQVKANSKKVTLEFNYQYTLEYNFEIFKTSILPKFFLDPWDRIFCEGKNQVPFVFSKKAHEEFLDSLDEFDDDSVVFDGERVELSPFWKDESELDSADWWDRVYTGDVPSVTSPEHQKASQNFAVSPGWNIESPSESLKDMLPKMKLPKSRVLVLGCGDSYDAALFAESGHVVTAVDISDHAIQRSKKLFGHMKNITWLQSDLFKLPSHFDGSFDLVYEYTCLCAINPAHRADLVQIWSRCLHEQGQMMGTLFCMHKRNGSPFGGSEWEFRELLKKRFKTLIWTRWRKSISRRQGRELFVLAQKRKML